MFSPFSYLAKPQYNSVTVVDPNLVEYGIFGIEIAMSGDALYAIARAQNRKETICFNGITGALRYRFVNQSTNMGESCAVSEDGRFAAISDPYLTVGGKINVGRVYLFNLQNGAFIRNIDCPNSSNLQDMFFGFPKLVFSRDGTRLAVATINYKYIISGYPSGFGLGAVHIFDTSNGNLVATCSPPSLITDNVNFGQSIELSKDGTRVIIGAGHRISGLDQVGRAYLFNATNGSLIHTFDSTNPKEFGNFAKRVAISTDNKISIICEPKQTQSTATNAGRIYIFNNDTGSLITTIANSNINTYRLLGLDAVLISNDKNRIYINAWDTNLNFTTLLAFNANTGAFIKAIPPARPTSGNFGSGYATSLSLTTDDSRMCVNHSYFPDADPLYPAMGGFYLYSEEIL